MPLPHTREANTVVYACVDRGIRMAYMSKFSTADVKRLAEMAHISLTDEEIAQIAEELEAITSTVDKIQEVAADDVPPTSHPIPMVNVVRPDTVGPTLDRESVLAAAPAAEDGQFAVPQMLEED